MPVLSRSELKYAGGAVAFVAGVAALLSRSVTHSVFVLLFAVVCAVIVITGYRTLRALRRSR